MKKVKKIAALFLAVVMVMAMGMTVAAKEVTVNSDLAKNPASITITNAKNGVTYKVYKVFDATETGEGENAKIAYTLRSGKPTPSTETGLKADANGNVTAIDDKQENLTATQVAALRTYAETYGELVATETADGEELVFKGLPYGYYMVVRDAAGEGNAAVTIDSTTPDMVIFDKNSTKPGPDPDDPDVKKADNGLVEVGGTAFYTVKFATTNYETIVTEDDPATDEDESDVEINKIYQYTIKDTVVGGFLDNIVVDSVIVYENGKNANGTTITPTPEFNEKNEMTINWTEDGTVNTDHKYKDGSILEIKYHGTVNNKIEDGAKNTNRVEIGWNGSTDPIEGEDDVYTASVIIDKVNGADKSKLSGAKFVLLDKAVAEDGIIPTGTKYYSFDTEGKVSTVLVTDEIKESNEWPNAAVKTTDDNGAATFPGLKADTKYYLYEIEAPTGFNRLVKTTEVVIDKVVTDAQTGEPTAESIAALNKIQPVENNAGTVLPSTGGIGTTIFYVVGGILVLGAAVLLITKKRMSARN